MYGSDEFVFKISRSIPLLLVGIKWMLRVLEELILQLEALIVGLDRLDGFGDLARPLFLFELAQFFSDDHTPRDRRKQSTGVDEPSARKRCSCTPLHWKPHFSSTLREAGLVTRAPA